MIKSDKHNTTAAQQDLNNNNVSVKPTTKSSSNNNSNSRKNRTDMTVKAATVDSGSSSPSSGNHSNHDNHHNNHNNSNNTQTMKVGKDAVAGLPNEKSLLDLMESSGYQLTHHNGQRKFGPPPDLSLIHI